MKKISMVIWAVIIVAVFVGLYFWSRQLHAQDIIQTLTSGVK